MDELRQRLLDSKLGERLHWQKPDVVETIGPYDPTVFDLYEKQLAEAIELLRERLDGYSDEQIAIILGEQLEDHAGLRKEWERFLESGPGIRLRQPPPWLAGGFGHPAHRADFEYWSKMPSFSIPEITCLSVGIDPIEYDERKLSHFIKDRDRSSFWPAVQYLVQRYELLMRQFGSRVDAKHFIFWADRVRLEIPHEFHQLLYKYHQPSRQATQKKDGASGPDKREIDKVAQLFTAMAIEYYGYDPKEARSPTPKEITDLAATMGLEITADTVRKYLRIGASFIPDDWQTE